MNSIKISLLFSLFLMVLTNISIGQNCIYPTSNLYVKNTTCALEASLCLDVAFADRTDFDIYVDGNIYAGAYVPCNYDTTSIYSVSDIYNCPEPDPDFHLDSLIINGVYYSFSFASLVDLVDSMNVIDVGGNWSFDEPSRNIRGGLTTNTYSWLYVTEQKTNKRFDQRVDFLFLPRGSEISLTNGIHEVVIDEIATACRDTITVEVFCPNNLVQRDTITLNQIDTVCFALDDLRGSSIVSITNICPAESGTSAMISTIPGTACIEVTGIDIGMDSACLVLVDDLGLVDTIYYTITVQQTINQGDFAANNLTISTIIDEPITFNPTANDSAPVVLDTIFISQDPNHGSAIVNTDGTISYTPDPGYESDGTPDSLMYTVCIGSDCRTATIYIDVVPPTLDIKSGFSPNQDGVNDTFVIDNLDLFTSNQLCIFNRWGNQVLQVENYQNDWDGTWDNSTNLPDGAYFYVLDVELDEQKEQYTGFVLIRR